MKLKKIYFDAFKSLVDEELEIKYSCIGFVGINESGKSNVLSAINTLGGKRRLTGIDTPRMAMERSPSLRFEFELENTEAKELQKKIENWEERYAINRKSLVNPEIKPTYHIEYNSSNTEDRHYSFTGISPKLNHLFLIPHPLNETLRIKIDGRFVPLTNALLIEEKDIQDNEEYWKNHEEHIKNSNRNTERIAETQSKISELNDRLSTENQSPISEEEKKKLKVELAEIQKLLKELNAKKTALERAYSDFDLPQLIKNKQEEILQLSIELDELKKNITNIETELNNLKAHPNISQDATLKTHYQTTIKTQSDEINKIKTVNESIGKKEKELEFLLTPLNKRYTKDIAIFNKNFSEVLGSFSESTLPKVVFWQHTKDYILKSQTSFSEILSKSSFDELSRPLVNIFRIGLGTKTFEELKTKIKETQSNPNERSRSERTLNNRVNEYIKSVWETYDQELNITLEKDQIRIEIYDPKPENGSYYNMEERSQGCQTFLSFLMTIGAEARHGVIKNTILLLDEPETHLHPSGVKFMLKELLKISENNNIVIYATHSIFMIDRENYERHIILKKENEITHLKPSNKGRIGFFMQEEVLYGALDINLSNEFSSTTHYNFVFEGDADAQLFEFFYGKALKKEAQPQSIKNTSFYQGGKCNDIKKYFAHKPIQLGSKWIFILDNDSPANDLKTFISGKYKDYINKDVYIFQYEKKDDRNQIELEDLLPEEVILDSYLSAFKAIDQEIEGKEILTHIEKGVWYFKFNEQILNTMIKDFSKKDEFKATFKNTLNKEIEKAVTSMNEADFKAKFKTYCEWANSIIVTLNSKEKTEKNHEKTEAVADKK